MLIFILWSITLCAQEHDVGDKNFISLYHDQPIYFLLGAPQAKGQISVKAKVFHSADIYLAYTQKVFWDLFDKSSPFRDVNYNPSVQYRFRWNKVPDQFLDFIPYEHESNGRAGAASRSWDRSAVRFQISTASKEKLNLLGSLKIWVPYNLEMTNADLAEYRGVYEFSFTLLNFMGKYFNPAELVFRFYPGGKFYVNPFAGGRELTLSFKGDSTAFLAKAVFQVFQGYAENMLEYDRSLWGIRAGIGL